MTKVLACLLVLSASACSASSSGGTASNDSAFTSERPDAAVDDVPAFTAAEGDVRYGARARVSIGGARFVESDAVGSIDGFHPALSLRMVVGGMPGGARIDFGRPGEGRPSIGTYSCADHDAALMRIDSDADRIIAHQAQTCRVVIDDVKPGPSDRYVIAFGRFDGSAEAFGAAVRGTFVASIPVDAEQPAQPAQPEQP